MTMKILRHPWVEKTLDWLSWLIGFFYFGLPLLFGMVLIIFGVYQAAAGIVISGVLVLLVTALTAFIMFGSKLGQRKK